MFVLTKIPVDALNSEEEDDEDGQGCPPAGHDCRWSGRQLNGEQLETDCRLTEDDLWWRLKRE